MFFKPRCFRRKPQRDGARYFAHGDVHTLPVPATPPMAVLATPQVSAHYEVALIERPVALRGRGAIDSDDGRTARGGKVKRACVAADE
jgi:hypothetical protein